MDHPGVRWAVVVGGGQGVVSIVHDRHVRGGGQPVSWGVATSGSTSWKPLWEATGLAHVPLSHAMHAVGEVWDEGRVMLRSR